MNAISLLEADHDKLKKLLGDLEATTERAEKTRPRLFAEIKALLTAHEAIEEEIFYPELKDHPKTRDIVLEGFVEHHVADLIVAELTAEPVTDEEWGAKVKVLRESIEHHIREEEEKMFKGAREVLDRSTLASLGERMEERKEALLAAEVRA